MHSPKGNIFLKADGSGQKATFAEAFPEVETLEGTVVETGPGNAGLGIRKIGRHSFREFINCSNVQCSGHGALTGNILRAMIKTRQTQYHEELLCEGHDESGKACANVFAITLKVTYIRCP